jgi:heme/copper-type cytochrome/quinol oxidase subunit 3
MTYFYLWSVTRTWPPSVPAPELRYGTINLVIMLASLIPNEYTKRAAERRNLLGVRIGMVICLVFAFAFIGVRWLEYTALNCRWDQDAYGSTVWVLLSLHTTHLLTDAYDSAVLGVLMFTGPLEGRRFVDVAENAMYWYFVVASWVVIYAVIYLVPRLL